MRKLTTCLSVCCVIIFYSCHNKKITFKKISKEDAVILKKNYIKADNSTIKKLYGDDIAKTHPIDTLRLESVPLSLEEIEEIKGILGEQPDLSPIEPKAKFDGYRIHLSLMYKDKQPEISYTITTGYAHKPIFPNQEKYLQDSLQWGIYQIIPPYGKKFPKPIFEKKHPEFKFHKICNPHCDGDEII